MENEWTRLGQSLRAGKILDQITLSGRTYSFNPKQAEFISDVDGTKNKFILFSGGRGCGKSLALCIKLILFCKCFPGNNILLGRKNLSDIEKTTLQDLFRLMPASWYEYRVKDGLIRFPNKSQIVLMGLDAMQSGSVGDIKKAQQKTKSLNLGGFFIDQLEEIEYEVFQSLNDTMRMMAPEGEIDFPRQGNMTTNPANFWGYHYFKLQERMNEEGNWIPKENKDARLLEGSMLDNAANLPEDFVKDRTSREESYVKRFVLGEWTTDVLLKGSVFAKEHIQFLESMVKPPLKIEEGCEIYEEPIPGEQYRMGVDPSEGITDPSAISVCTTSGRKVAVFNAMATIPQLADKVKYLYWKYKEPLVIPEVNKSAILEHIKDLRRLYKRRQLDYKLKKETEKLGFITSWQSKQALITHFQTLLRSKSVRIYDRKTIEEMKVFVWSDEAKMQGAGASAGFHDDNIMATLLSYFDMTPQRAERERISILEAEAPPIKKTFQYK